MNGTPMAFVHVTLTDDPEMTDEDNICDGNKSYSQRPGPASTKVNWILRFTWQDERQISNQSLNSNYRCQGVLMILLPEN